MFLIPKIKYYLRKIIDSEVKASPRVGELLYVHDIVKQWTRLKIQSGPFKGLQYMDTAHGSAFSPKLLGTYEKELHPVITEIMTLKPKSIINIGNAEGYYSVGFAIQLPESKIIAFEVSQPARVASEELAKINGCFSQITTYGRCDAKNLRSVIQDNGPQHTILCDIEGAEVEVLDPVLIPELAECYILVEIHTFERTDCLDIMSNRFNSTHEINQFTTEPRTKSDLPDGLKIKSRHIETALSESRSGSMNWLWLKPKKNSSD